MCADVIVAPPPCHIHRSGGEEPHCAHMLTGTWGAGPGAEERLGLSILALQLMSGGGRACGPWSSGEESRANGAGSVKGGRGFPSQRYVGGGWPEESQVDRQRQVRGPRGGH